MNINSETFTVPVNTVEEELITYRMTPMYMSDDGLYFFNKSDLFRLDYDGIFHRLKLANFDEVVLDNNEPIAYMITYNSSSISAKVYDIIQEKFLYSKTIFVNARFIDKALVTTSSTGASIWYTNDGSFYQYCSLTTKSISNNCDINVSFDVSKGDLVLDSYPYLCFFEDLGVSGSNIKIVNITNNRKWTFRSNTVFTALHGKIFVPLDANQEENEDPTVVCVIYNDECITLHVPGIIVESAGNDNFAIFSVFTGDDTEVYVLTIDDLGNFILKMFPILPGYKTFSPNGNLIYVRGFENFGTIFETDKIIKEKNFDKNSIKRKSKNDFLIFNELNTNAPTIIHFHGGPESFEVPEPRMFGMPQYAISAGWNWIGVNYHGSLSPTKDFTKYAWRNWRESLTRDIDKALDLTNGDIIFAGWSFGAAIALAFASHSPRIKGLLLGGTPGDLKQHMRFASNIDISHRLWFNERFDFNGDDGLLFNGVSGFTSNVKIIEFHGKLDKNCPLKLSDNIAMKWEMLGNPWKRFIFPNCEHYPSDQSDVLVFVKEARSFLHHVLD
ncbi:S9 family peptidase [Gardnerella vaginalis]|uniref:alpha/beta hydrolase family protein n=1 Tax=Gardnerella vaginalis TaxID=2702 RepID=UPI000C79939C|nr:hypothetical protein [Gardnerella vaginalis]PKY96946.1 hypothetical protein CYJ58_02500 [Gardnerella vaginalis]